MKSLRKYGVGSCGPRGFYGTVGRCELVDIFCTLFIALFWWVMFNDNGC